MKKNVAQSILKIVLELIVIFVVLKIGVFISELVKPIIFVPGSIMGMILLLLILTFEIIKVGHIELSGKFLLKNMGFFFIPLGVGLINSVDLLKDVWMELLIIIVISGSIVMLVSAKVTDIIIGITDKMSKGGEN